MSYGEMDQINPICNSINLRGLIKVSGLRVYRGRVRHYKLRVVFLECIYQVTRERERVRTLSVGNTYNYSKDTFSTPNRCFF